MQGFNPVKINWASQYLTGRPLRLLFLVVLEWVLCQTPALAQRTPYVGVLGGVSTLSADAGSVLTSQSLLTSSYKPENGPLVNAVAGVHFHEYLSLQFNYVWNRNHVTMNSASSASNSFYLQQRTSSQQSAIVDLLVYFRRKNSRLRPYLGVGTGVVHFSSTEERTTALGGTPVLPPVHFSSTQAALHVPVGIDLAVTRQLTIRYSFSETIRHNDVSEKLSPPGERSLASFYNLVGVLIRF
jgi:hypothetical protein